jgi:transcriptional regulator with XRE-family HTH domain
MIDDEVQDDAVAEGAITRALGEELRRARDSVGWTRAELVERAPSDLQVRTYATYEHGSRQCTVTRFVEICAALGVSAPDVLELALQRAEVHLETIGLQVDLRALLDAEQSELEPLRRWATNRLRANTDRSGVARLTTAVLQEMAVCLDLTRAQLVRYLVRFTPQAVARR